MTLEEANHAIRKAARDELKRIFGLMFVASMSEPEKAGPHFSHGVKLLLECETKAVAIIGEQLRKSAT